MNSAGTLSAWGISAAVANNIALNGGTVGTVATDAGNVTFSGAVTVGSGGGYLTATSTGTTTFSGQILGGGMLTKTGTSGTVILTGTTNSWSGGTTVNGGTLQVGTGIANGSLPDVAGTVITLGSVATVSGTTTSYNGTLFINSANNTNLLNTVITTAAGGTAVGNLTVNGSGIVTLGQANTYNGTSQVGADDGAIGFLRVQNSAALGTGTLNVAGGSNTGAFQLAGSGLNITNPINLDGRRDNQNLGLAPQIENISGSNTISSAIGCNVWGNEYIFQSDAGKLTIAGNITNNTGNATARFIYLQGAGDGELAGTIQNGSGTGAQSLIKAGAGTWTISTYQSYTGSTTIQQGTLALGPLGSLSTPSIQVMSGATFDVRNFTGTNVWAGQILSGGGTVVGDVTDSGASVFSPGDTSGVGTLTCSNSLNLAGGDYINYNISGATADRLNVGGTMTLNGITTISVLPNKVLPGTVYTVATAGTLVNGSNVIVDSSTTRYTFTPSVSADGKSILLTAAGSNLSLAWNGGYSNWDINASAAWNTTDTFFNADDVTFSDNSGNTTVTIADSVRPASLTVNNNANDYTFVAGTDPYSNPGKITGDVGLTKQGTGTLILNLANDYTGVTSILGGTIRIGASGATLLSNTVSSALGSTSGGTTVNGGTLDTNGQNLGAEPITVQGTGVGGNGAIVNNSGTTQNNTLRFVTLAGNATLGGTTRWDIRTDNPTTVAASLTGNGYTLSKAGANTIYLVNLGGTDLGNININAGALGLQGTTTLGRTTSGYNTATVATSATLSFYAVTAGNVIAKNLDLKDGSTVYNGGGNSASMAGNTTLEGGATSRPITALP